MRKPNLEFETTWLWYHIELIRWTSNRKVWTKRVGWSLYSNRHVFHPCVTNLGQCQPIHPMWQTEYKIVMHYLWNKISRYIVKIFITKLFVVPRRRYDSDPEKSSSQRRRQQRQIGNHPISGQADPGRPNLSRSMSRSRPNPIVQRRSTKTW